MGTSTVAISGIAESAFEDMIAMQSVTFASDSVVTNIESNAFRNCGLLGEVTLPSSLETLGDRVFEGNKIVSFAIENNSEIFAVDGGILYHQDENNKSIYGVLKVAPNILAQQINVNENCLKIEDYAFVSATGVERVTGTNVTDIGVSAFENSTLYLNTEIRINLNST